MQGRTNTLAVMSGMPWCHVPADVAPGWHCAAVEAAQRLLLAVVHARLGYWCAWQRFCARLDSTPEGFIGC